jgi:hypothetical protein
LNPSSWHDRAMNRRQFEELRRWGAALRSDEREELRAAGEGIRRLCLEVDRLERELGAAEAVATGAASEDAVEVGEEQPEMIEASLRERVQRRLAALHR